VLLQAYYQILDVPRGAADKEIKAAYRSKAIQWHPDKFSGKERQDALKRFGDIAEAFTVLSNGRSFDQTE